MTKCELTLTYIGDLTWGMGVMLLKGLTVRLNMRAEPLIIKNYTHLWKLKHCANVDSDANTDADKRRLQRLDDNISSTEAIDKMDWLKCKGKYGKNLKSPNTYGKCGKLPLRIASSESITDSPHIEVPISILYKSIAGRYRPVSYPNGPITARYRFIKNAYWGNRWANDEAWHNT